MKFPEPIHESVASLSREQTARALSISVDCLDRLHDAGRGPPRFRVSPRRWAYPVRELRKWQQEALSADASTGP
jgi:hypothetical protein